MSELLAPARMTRRQEAGGHHLNGYLGSKVDVVLRAPESANDEVLIPATPNFFTQYRYV